MVDAEQVEQTTVGPLHRRSSCNTPNLSMLASDFDVADLDGNMIFFGMELKKSS